MASNNTAHRMVFDVRSAGCESQGENSVLLFGIIYTFLISSVVVGSRTTPRVE